MAFKTKELATSISIPGTNGWLYVVGCGPISVICDHTQPTAGRPFERVDSIDFENVATPDDLTTLKYELQERLKQVNKAISNSKKAVKAIETPLKTAAQSQKKSASSSTKKVPRKGK